MSRQRFQSCHRGLLLQGLQISDERIDIGGRQLGIPVGHRRLARRLALGGHLLGSQDPGLYVSSAELLADAVKGVRLVALARDVVTPLALLRRVDFLSTLCVLSCRSQRRRYDDDERNDYHWKNPSRDERDPHGASKDDNGAIPRYQ